MESGSTSSDPSLAQSSADMQENTPNTTQPQSFPGTSPPQELRDVLSSYSAVPSSRLLSAFRDIMRGHEDMSDLMWVSREWNPRPMSQHASKRSPAKIRHDVMTSPRMQHVIEQLSEEKGVPQEQLWLQLHEILSEMGQTQTMPVVRWFGFALSKIMRRIYKGVYVNEESIERLRASVGDNPVLFMPSHRSYADFLLMSYVCFHYNIMLPVIAAGMDFVAMWGMGRLLRDSGAFFIRRSFGSDRLYWAAFSEYVQTLITAGDAPLEFFVEGTRSRTAKSLCPKLGLLSVALEPFFTGQVSDILVVPINISYDRTLEETLYSYELLGIPKPKESTSGLLKALQVLDEQYGRIHVDFTRPISIRQFCGDLRSVRLLRPLHLQYEPGPEEGARVVKLAHHVVREQQQHAVISVFSLAALALSSQLSQRRPALSLNELTKEIAWLRSVTETLGALVDVRGDMESAVREAIQTHKSLVQLTSTNTVQLRNIHTPQKSIDTTKLRGHSLGPITLEVGVPVVMLQHYINQTLHLLICPAIVTLAMQHSAVQGRANKAEVFAKYKFLRGLLSHEFILHKAWEEMDFEDALKQLDLLHIVEETTEVPSRLVVGNHRKLQTLLIHLLSPFLGGYLACCHTVAKMAVASPVTLAQILQASQHTIEKRLSSGEISHHYCLSLDLLSAAVNSLTAMGGLTRTKENGKVLYQATEDKIRHIASTLADLQKPLPPVNQQEQDSAVSTDQLLVQERAKL